MSPLDDAQPISTWMHYKIANYTHDSNQLQGNDITSFKGRNDLFLNHDLYYTHQVRQNEQRRRYGNSFEQFKAIDMVG